MKFITDAVKNQVFFHAAKRFLRCFPVRFLCKRLLCATGGVRSRSAAAFSSTISPRRFHASSAWTDIFIYPGYHFKCIDALVTNFHLPESTLIMLVSALAGREHILNAYRVAVEERYRFFSFGDAMLIL